MPRPRAQAYFDDGPSARVFCAFGRRAMPDHLDAALMFERRAEREPQPCHLHATGTMTAA
jgi:hypothetical protein